MTYRDLFFHYATSAAIAAAAWIYIHPVAGIIAGVATSFIQTRHEETRRRP